MRSLSIFTLGLLSLFIAGRNKQMGIHTYSPEIFEKGCISTQDNEFGATFSPDGKTCFFTKTTASTIQSSTIIICVSYLKNGKWLKPAIAPFSGRYKDFNPMFSPDGEKLFFISNRTSNDKKTFDCDIWVVNKLDEGWSEPENIGAPINSHGWELGCSVANNGTIYFSSTGTTGNADIYYSRFVDGKYQKPDTLSDAINSPYSETDPFISPDEGYLLFTSQYRLDALIGPGADSNYPRQDIYISYKKEGKWQPAQNIGNPVNSDAAETNPFISADGKTLFYTSERNFVSIPMKKKLIYSEFENKIHDTQNGLGDIYQISSRCLEKFKK
ncbi:MAG: hypothetical protein ABJA78_18905 [Ferruginibacter sp.]